MVATAHYVVRPMTTGDIDQVAEVEREAFPTAWPPTVYRRELVENSLARYLVAMERRPEAGPAPEAGLWARLRRLWGDTTSASNDLVVGFVGLWLLTEEAHVTTIAVRGGYRRRGIGERLLIASIELARKHRQRAMTLEYRVSNLAAKALYEKYAFRAMGIRPRYYSDNNEDAIIMTTDPILSEAYTALLDQRTAEHHRRFPELYDPSV